MEPDRTETTTLNISLPTELRAFIEERARLGGFHSVSEYMRDVMRQERRRVEQEKLERLLLEGLESGEPIPVTKEYFERKLAELTARHSPKKPNGSG
jgi:antitoxin ParD1/3/4